MPATKVATCCYCGTRAALVLSGDTLHELTCSNCGAPLHDLKMLPKSHKGKHSEPLGASPTQRHGKPGKRPKVDKKSLKKKKKKGFAARFFDEAFDIFDDIFD